MNKQGSRANGFGGIEWCHILGPMTGYTANPVRGCKHDCKWRMGVSPRSKVQGPKSDGGKIVACYAKTMRDRLDGEGAFENITFHPEVLEEIRSHKTPAGIFIDSMSDLFGVSVPEDWIRETIETMKACPQHVFFTLTKNPGALRKWIFPDNVLVGISAPPSFMYGKELSPEQQYAWLDKGLAVLGIAIARWKWISIEPLSFDVAPLIEKHRETLNWAVIGAGSDGARTFQPNEDHFDNCMEALRDKPVFFKGNIDPEFVKYLGYEYRQEWPELRPGRQILRIGSGIKQEETERTEV